jgi:L-asparagine transporter-like permease
MAAASAITRLAVYVATCAATLRQRRADFAGTVKPATLTLPLGPVIPVAALAIAVTILAGATFVQLTAGAAAFAAGAILYFVAVRGPGHSRMAGTIGS